MNCNEAQLNILLKDSGELSGNQLKDLDIHLKRCKSCIQYSKASQNVMELAVEDMPDNGPSAGILESINTQAQMAKRRPLIFRRHIIQWAAAAALLLIVLGNWSFTPKTGSPETEISDMYAVLTLITDNSYPAEEEAVDDIPAMDALMLQIENTSEDYELTEEELWAPQPISPQSYNTREIPLKIYG